MPNDRKLLILKIFFCAMTINCRDLFFPQARKEVSFPDHPGTKDRTLWENFYAWVTPGTQTSLWTGGGPRSEDPQIRRIFVRIYFSIPPAMDRLGGG
jgi:hypothetical protein